MELISRKYIVLMGSEPLTVYIKNNQVQSAKFMEKKIQLHLDEEAIRLIKDNPTKIVNGNNLLSNDGFTRTVSKMMDSKLKLAIAKNDKKTLSRFARSELIPENMKHNFIEAINRQSGLRGVLTRAVINTNAIFQNLAKKIDKFFDKVNDKVANKTLDPYLKDFQLQHVNKAPPLTDQDLKKYLDPKLMELAEEFYKEKGLHKRDFDTRDLRDKILLNEFLEQGVSKGFSVLDSKIALFKTEQTVMTEAKAIHYHQELQDSNKIIKELQNRLNVFEQQQASKNETINDFMVLSKHLKQVDKIDVLAANKEYLSMLPQEQEKFENLHIFKYEPLQDRMAEIHAAFKELEKQELINTQKEPQKVETIIDRTASIDFFDKSLQAQITQEWQTQQAINRESASPTRDFMNISAVRFGGVSEASLNKWALAAKSNAQIDSQTIDKFVEASLRNAKELQKIGVLNETAQGEYKFVDNFAKQALYQNIDKTVPEIEKANQGIQKQVVIDRDEIKERVQHMSSEASFKDMLTPNGDLDSKKLFEYAQKLQSVAAALHEKESPNITRESLQRVNQGVEKSQGAENVRG